MDGFNDWSTLESVNEDLRMEQNINESLTMCEGLMNILLIKIFRLMSLSNSFYRKFLFNDSLYLSVV